MLPVLHAYLGVDDWRRILTVRVARVLGSLLGRDGNRLQLVDAVEDHTGGDEERPHGLQDGSGVSAEAEESHR